MMICVGYKFKNRKDGTKATTRIKNVKGDQATFIRELRALLQLPAPASGKESDDTIRTRVGGVIEVKGNHVRTIKLWLAGLGF
jgi:Mitochondrial large subunit ribosomal protein (Img2)